MSFKEGATSFGILKEIRPSSQLGAKENFPVAIVGYGEMGEEREGWFPIKDGDNLTPGDKLKITVLTRSHPSGGSLTIHRLEKV